MFCIIKFVYYKSFCVRDDIGSYIRTVYHMVSHTPKRNVVSSSLAGGAITAPESPEVKGFGAFLFPSSVRVAGMEVVLPDSVRSGARAQAKLPDFCAHKARLSEFAGSCLLPHRRQTRTFPLFDDECLWFCPSPLRPQVSSQ